MSYVLDTNIFNKLVDGTINPADLPSDGAFVATHIQIDEINNTNDSGRRAQLYLMFAKVRPKIIPTESFAFGVSRWGNAKFSHGALFMKLKQELDAMNGSKSNNIQDVMIAEVALANSFTLLTSDRHLAEAVEKIGGKVVLFKTS